MHRPTTILVRKNSLNLPWASCSVRGINDIPWYHVTDTSHLHVIDLRTTRRKFELKLQKLEAQKMASERRKHAPNQAIKPADLPSIQIPTHIKRGPSDVLR